MNQTHPDAHLEMECPPTEKHQGRSLLHWLQMFNYMHNVIKCIHTLPLFSNEVGNEMETWQFMLSLTCLFLCLLSQLEHCRESLRALRDVARRNCSLRIGPTWKTARTREKLREDKGDPKEAPFIHGRLDRNALPSGTILSFKKQGEWEGEPQLLHLKAAFCVLARGPQTRGRSHT